MARPWFVPPTDLASHRSIRSMGHHETTNRHELCMVLSPARLTPRTVTSLHRGSRWMSVDLLQTSSGCFWQTCGPQRTSWNIWFRLKLGHQNQHALQHLRRKTNSYCLGNRDGPQRRSVLKFRISRPGFLMPYTWGVLKKGFTSIGFALLIDHPFCVPPLMETTT